MQVLVLPENKDINYIKTVQEVKRFFADFERFRVITGLSKKPHLLRNGFLEEPQFAPVAFLLDIIKRSFWKRDGW